MPIYLSNKASPARVREAEHARKNRQEILKALSLGEITRRDLYKWGIFTVTGALALKHGLSPCFNASAPVTVKIPHLYRSRRVISPSERALRISWRFLRACSASRTRAGDALLER